jgi:1-acyl-sn-glycerol-3-phosphate acyltransferase
MHQQPISRFPAVQPQVNWPRYFAKLITFMVIIIWSSISLVAIQICATSILASQIPLWILMPKHKERIQIWFYEHFRLITRFTQRMFTVAVVVTCSFLIPDTTIHLSGDILSMKKVKKAILIANHQIYADCIFR